MKKSIIILSISFFIISCNGGSSSKKDNTMSTDSTTTTTNMMDSSSNNNITDSSSKIKIDVSKETSTDKKMGEEKADYDKQMEKDTRTNMGGESTGLLKHRPKTLK